MEKYIADGELLPGKPFHIPRAVVTAIEEELKDEINVKKMVENKQRHYSMKLVGPDGYVNDMTMSCYGSGTGIVGRFNPATWGTLRERYGFTPGTSIKFSWCSDKLCLRFDFSLGVPVPFKYFPSYEESYECYSSSHIQKPHLEKGDKIIVPRSVRHLLENQVIEKVEYPLLYELSNPATGHVSHCGVLEFTSDEGSIYVPSWMMKKMLLQDGDIVKTQFTTLPKGTFVKLQPHNMEFLDLSNPIAVLKASLRNFTSLTTGDAFMIEDNNKKFLISVMETKPSPAVRFNEDDCEIDVLPPLDYKEPEKPLLPTPTNKRKPEDVEEAPAEKVPKFSAFTGSGRRLDGKASTVANEDTQKSKSTETEKPSRSASTPSKESTPSQKDETTSSPASAKRLSGKLVFGSNAKLASSSKPKVTEAPPAKAEEPKFQAFTGKKNTLK